MPNHELLANRAASDAQLLRSKLRDAEQRIASLQRDAARYRFLRDQNWNDAPLCVVVDPKAAVKIGHDCPSGERLDAAIDRAAFDA